MRFQPPNTTTGVELVTGCFTCHTVDLVIPAKGFDFKFQRWHRSDAILNTAFQFGWQYDWDERLTFDAYDGSVRYWGPGFQMSRFIRNQDETFSPAVPWIYSTLELLPDGRYRLTFKNQEKRYFSGTTGKLLQRVDLSGNTQSFAWGGFGLQQIEDASGRIVTVSNSPGPENTTTTVTDWIGRTLTYERKHPSHMGFLTRYIDPEGVATDYTIDTHDAPDSPRFMGVESITYANGLWLTNYPVSDLSPQTTVVGRQVFGNGLVVEYQYDQAARRTSVQEGDRVSLHEWDAEGNLIQRTDPLGNVWTYQYNGQKLVARVTDPNLATVNKTYDNRGNLLTREDQKGNVWTYEYDSTFNKVTRLTGPAPDHNQTTFTYDQTTGVLLTRTDPLQKTTAYEYHPDGLLKKVTPPGTNPATTEFTYDEDGNLVEVRNGLDQATTFEYDAVGNQVAVVDALGHKSTREYDLLNRPTLARSPLGNATRTAYDGNGNLVTVTDPLNRGTRLELDSLNQLTRVLDPAGGVVSYSYDLFGNLVRQVDPNGHAYEFGYDDLDRQIRTVDPMGQVTTVEHPPYCGTTVTTDAEGHATTLYRDVTCQVTERAFDDGSSFAFSYDTEGRRVGASSLRGGTYGSFLYGARTYGSDAEETTFEYDANSRLTSVTYPGDHTLGFAWDDAGRLSSLTDIHGTATAYGYDAGNRLTTVTRAGKATTYQYDEAGRLASLVYPNGVSCDFTYDHDSRVTRMLWEKDATLLYHIEYRYDRAGNRTRRMVTKSPEAAVIEDFNYDALSRLVRVDENGSLRAHYKYDPAGNRLLKKRPPTLSSPDDGVVVDNDELYEYDASDELVAMNSTRFRWDRVGQLVEKDDPTQANPTRYEWNAAHRLAKVTLPNLTAAEYRYNGDELRTWRREPSGAETNCYWVPSGILGLSQVLNETDGDGAPKANYVLGPNVLIAIVDGSGHERYYITDALGSVLALTDDTGAVTDTYAYDEYGILIASIGSTYNPQGFTGQYYDGETRFCYLRNRHYAPEQGCFIRRDPTGSMGIASQYLYADNDPTTFSDPLGLYDCASSLKGMKNIVLNLKEHLSRPCPPPGDINRQWRDLEKRIIDWWRHCAQKGTLRPDFKRVVDYYMNRAERLGDWQGIQNIWMEL